MPGYVLDSSVLIYIGRHMPDDVFQTPWKLLRDGIASGHLCSPEEVRVELKRGNDTLLLKLDPIKGLWVPLDDGLGKATERVNEVAPRLADPESERSKGDPFVVALGLYQKRAVVSLERPRKDQKNGPHKIPDACKELDIECLDFFNFCRKEGWKF